jgi:hypothetical protein
MNEENKKRHYRDITLKIELSSTDEYRLEEVVQKLIENLNTKTTKTIKYSRLFHHRDPVSLDSHTISRFPRK